MSYKDWKLTDFSRGRQQLIGESRLLSWGYEVATCEDPCPSEIVACSTRTVGCYDDARFDAEKMARRLLREFAEQAAAEGGEPFARSLWIRVFCYVDEPLFFAECSDADAANKGVYDLERWADVETAYSNLSLVYCLAYGQDDAERLAMALLPQDEEEEGENERIAAEMVRRESYSDMVVYDDWEEVESDD